MVSVRKVEVLQPGLVVIRNALTIEQQVQFASYAMRCQESFFTSNGALNSARSRGRVFDAISALPGAEVLGEVSRDIISTASSLDSTLQPVLPTHMLMLLYTASRGMGYHVDDGENDGDGDAPIVSVNIGTGCLFGVKRKQAGEDGFQSQGDSNGAQGSGSVSRDDADVIRLLSGDAVLFGGPSRMIPHSVVKVLKTECPAPPEVAEVMDAVGGGRLNFTFRHAPSVLGKEAAFKFYNAVTKTASAAV